MSESMLGYAIPTPTLLYDLGNRHRCGPLESEHEKRHHEKINTFMRIDSHKVVVPAVNLNDIRIRAVQFFKEQLS